MKHLFVLLSCIVISLISCGTFTIKEGNYNFLPDESKGYEGQSFYPSIKIKAGEKEQYEIEYFDENENSKKKDVALLGMGGYVLFIDQNKNGEIEDFERFPMINFASDIVVYTQPKMGGSDTPTEDNEVVQIAYQLSK